MENGEPHHEELIFWDIMISGIVPFRVRSNGCMPDYPEEPIGVRYEFDRFRSLCHRCYVRLLVHNSIPTLVNICMSSLFNDYNEDIRLVDHRRVGSGTIHDFGRWMLRKCKPELIGPVKELILRIRHPLSRFDKYEGGGLDYSENGQRGDIPLPVLCCGSQVLPHHYTIYPAYYLVWKEWSRVHFPGMLANSICYDDARFQCEMCRSTERYYTPEIDYVRTEIGYVKRTIEYLGPLYRMAAM